MRLTIPTALALVLFAPSAAAQVVLSTSGAASTQTFDTLSSTGPSSALPTGWAISEATYASDTGTATAGGIYSYGSMGSSDRALGMIQSTSTVPTIGARFRNSTGATITSLKISYVGEQWRLGSAGRTDRIDFQYSTNATSLSSGSWTDVDALDFTSPTTTTAGAKDGNAAANRAALTATITGLTIADGTDFWIRWQDFNPVGSDDGLAVDDFSLTPNPAALLADGAACSAGPECTSGHCVDMVCCATVCDLGVCDACSVAAGADTNGTCKVLTGTTCTDGDACTTGDVCGATGCAGTPLTCTPLSECHNAGSCAAGVCSTPTKTDGSPCTGGTCAAGVCVPTVVDSGADTSTPDTSTPDTSTPDTSTPDTSVADTFVADTFVADTFVADTFVADTFVADTFVADTFVADAADATVADAAEPDATLVDAADATTPPDTGAVVEDSGELDTASLEPSDTGSAPRDTSAGDTGAEATPAIEEDSGCGCRTAGGANTAGGWLAWAALALVAARRRRS